MKKLKRLIALLFVVAMVFAAAGCSNTENPPAATDGTGATSPPTTGGSNTTTSPPTTDVLKEVSMGQIATSAPLDRTRGTYIVTWQITMFLYEGMVTIDFDTGELIPCLIKEMPAVSDDGLVYTFKLKEGVKFHNGADFTAADVKYNIERILNPSTEGVLVQEDFVGIVGAQDMLDGKTTELAGLKIINDHELTITLTEPFAPFLLFAASTPIYPREACEAAGADWGTGMNCIGTGPFKLESHAPDTLISLSRFDGYHGDLPKVDIVNYKQYADINTMLLEYEKGSIDACQLDSTLMAEYNSKFPGEVFSYPTFGQVFTLMNQNMEPWSDIRVREALAYAIDNDAIANDLLGGVTQPAGGLINPSIMGHDPALKPKPYDPEKAKQMLADAGYPDGVTSKAYSTNLESSNGKVLLAIQAMARPAGFNFEIEQVDSATWTEMRRTGQVQFAISGWYLDTSDADLLMYGFYHSSMNKLYSGFYNNPEYDSLVEQARRVLDTAERSELYRQADYLLTQVDYTTIPIHHPTNFFLAKPYLIDFTLSGDMPRWRTCDVDMSAKK